MTNERDKYFIKWLEEKFAHQDKKMDDNTKLTKEVLREQKDLSKRVGAVEVEVFNEAKRLPPIWRDPTVIKTIMYVALAFLLLVAAVTRFDIGAIL